VFSVTNILPTVEVARGNIEYQYQHSGIPYTQFTWLLLNNCSMPDERDPSNFYTLSIYFGHKLHYIKVGQRGREIKWVGFPIWNKCSVMSRTCQKTLATWNIWSLKASKHIHKKWSSLHTAKQYWFIYILAHLLVKSLFNQHRDFYPVWKLALNVQILESLNPEGT
jgi:hypothetical protein